MLTLIEKIPYRLPSGTSKPKWRCVCDCGKETIVFASNLNTTQSCGCLSTKASNARRENLIGETFGYLTVIDFAKDRIGSSGKPIVRFKCQCICGTVKDIDSAELKKGTVKSCGCKRNELLSKAINRDLTGKKINKITVLEQLPSRRYGHGSMSRYLCKCDCGTIFEVFGTVLRRNQMSCGCVTSKGEEKVAQLLTRWNVPFVKQYSYEDLVSPYGNKLMFDFMIKDRNNKEILIEYQGIQHYEKQSNGFGDYVREVTDPLKKKYCSKNNISLYEIRYDEDIETSLQKILSENSIDTVPYDDNIAS